MVDRAAIFADVTSRAALRKQACLPPLDVAAEYRRAVSLAIDAEVRALAPAHQNVLQRIRAEVTAEFLPHFGPARGASWGGRYAAAAEATRRFDAYLRAVHGTEAPPTPARHPVRYGDGQSSA